MTKNELIDALATYFDIETGDNDKYDLTSYDWTSGCGFKGGWLSLKNVIYALEDLCNDDEWDDNHPNYCFGDEDDDEEDD